MSSILRNYCEKNGREKEEMRDMAAERESMLIMKNVSKTFNPGTVNEKCALNGVNLTLGAGDFATIVGSNGAGKSTLFNALAGEKISIVKDTPGVTRDRIYADVSWLDYNFTIIDTGGIEPESDNIILKSMREQAEIAIETADVIIFMTDVRQGLVDDDHKVVQMLRKSKKPVILVVNKVDSFEKYMNDVYEFYNLGLGDPVPISGASRLGIGDMLDEVVSHFDEESKNENCKKSRRLEYEIIEVLCLY
jgi:small GTP-binding protein